jgi:hypothetical protein
LNKGQIKAGKLAGFDGLLTDGIKLGAKAFTGGF